jgi:serine protease
LSLEALEDRCLLSSGIIPNDPRFHQQWGLDVTEASRAWEITTGRTRVTVAVIDSGIDYTHPDLYRNIWLNQSEIPSAIRTALSDVDGDGLVTFWDLNEPVNQGPGKITDLNGNGYVDGGDVLRPVAEGGWADGRDNGHNGYIDDLNRRGW